jgi:hypothetical protein
MHVRANTICNYTICDKDIGYNLCTHMYLICTCTYTGSLISQRENIPNRVILLSHDYPNMTIITGTRNMKTKRSRYNDISLINEDTRKASRCNYNYIIISSTKFRAHSRHTVFFVCQAAKLLHKYDDNFARCLRK